MCGAPADQVEETPGRASLGKLGCRTPPQLNAGGVGQQQHEYCETGSSSDGSETMDSDSDSASDCLVLPSPKLTSQGRKFEKIER